MGYETTMHSWSKWGNRAFAGRRAQGERWSTVCSAEDFTLKPQIMRTTINLVFF